MSFDFRRGEMDSTDSGAKDYEAPSNFRNHAHAWRADVPQHQRASAKRMVVIRPKQEGKTWVRESINASLAGVLKQLVEDMELKHGPQSSLQQLLFSEEYMAVIGMGPSVVPLLLADLKSGNTPWFWALKAITRENVGSDVGPGDFRSLREAWLAWGATKGLL